MSDDEVIGGPPRRDLAALAELAAQVCDVRSAAIYLSAGDEMHQVAGAGDELDDPGFEASGRIESSEGVSIGSIRVFDNDPKVLSVEQAAGLQKLADRVVDVLELHQRTKQLERLSAELAAARDESRSAQEAFVGQVSHDLRNPLTSVSMSLEMLKEQPSVIEDEDALWMVDRALGGARRMDVLIGSLVAYARAGGAPDSVRRAR